ncbi:ROK family protein [Populibacterium corticicola]|jgi:predicted NBD/HSP70 family sugar kinase|uniref:ROK family protein n=1 Tax=Populibacterium corticicola TaxID=1812826 RepID=A0ABW5XF10_9MICO
MTSTVGNAGLRSTRGLSAQESSKVSLADVRQRNRALILQALYKGEPQSRADLARATGLTRVTASDVISELLELNLVEEVGQRSETRVGKPATLVTVKYEAHNIVALELSDEQEFRGAVLTLGGDIIKRDSITLDGEKGDDALKKVLQLARRLIKKAHAPVLGIGVGTPGVVTAQGVIAYAPNLGWSNLDLSSELTAQLSLPAYVANDADTAVLAESTFGEGSVAGLMLVQIGHGVGAGILCDGHLLRGPDGTAGEIGHTKVTDAEIECSCGRNGCLEALIAAPRLRARLKDVAEPQRSEELTQAGTMLGQVIAPVVQALGLFDCVLYGPMELLEDPFLEATKTTVNGATSHFSDRMITVRLSALGGDGVLSGAAAHVLGGELGLI